MSLRARLAVLLAATFVMVAAFAATLLRADDPQVITGGAAPYAGAVRPPGIPPQGFRLRDQDGRVRTLTDVRGQVAIVSFQYTTCEDTCPLTTQQIRGALDELGHDVPVLAFAVDPANDTPARAERFLAEQRMVGRMDFLLGSRAELEPQWRAYGIQPQGEGFEHTAHVVLLDRSGVQRVGWPVAKLTPEGLAADVRKLESAGAARAALAR